MIKAVAFDLWEVVAKKRPRVFDLVAAELGLGREARPYFLELLDVMEQGRLSEDQFWDKFLTRFQLSPRKVTPWVEHYKHITHLNQPLLSLISELHSNYKIGLISNTDPAAAEYLRKSRALVDFDVTIFSCEAGGVKPGPAIYQAALERLEVRPAELVFVDDRPVMVEGAQNLGINGLVFEGIDKLKPTLQSLLDA